MMKRGYLVCNTAWMRDYQGAKGDKSYSNASYINKHGYGTERFNFKKVGQKLYGYAFNRGERINLARLSRRSNAEYLDNVTIIWTAPRKGYGQVLVGWYKNARVYRSPKAKPRYHLFEAQAKDCTLLDTDKRFLRVPRGKGAMGQSNIWYPSTAKGLTFIKVVRQLMAGKLPPLASRKSSENRSWQRDLEIRLRIERKAIRAVGKHFQEIGYGIKDVQKDNKGWDLEATRNGIVLRLEVKGLALQFQTIELTPNEFSAMKTYATSWRLCVVSNLENAKPKFHIYEYSPEAEQWRSKDGSPLKITTVRSARCAPA